MMAQEIEQRPVPEGWPQPSAEAVAHSRQLSRLVAERVRDGEGWLSFHDWMEAVLYAPGLGYYSAGAARFGAAGDFVTAPGVSSLFGRTLARQCAEILIACDGDTILEFGPGNGRLAVDILQALEAMDALPERYLMLDRSGALRAEQEASLAALGDNLRQRVTWLDHLPAEPVRGLILANEVADALPVHRFRRTEEGVRCLGVGLDGGRFVPAEREAGERLQEAVAAVERDLGRRLATGYVSEYSPSLPGWIGSLSDCLAAGLALVIDYGYPRAEYYHPQRREGTLRCHYRHRSHDDWLMLPGLQDITAFVDFTAAAEAAVTAGLEVAGYASQAHFLMGAGITEVLSSSPGNDSPERVNLAQQAKALMLPGEMGERFRVLGLARNLPCSVSGFSLYNHVRKL